MAAAHTPGPWTVIDPNGGGEPIEYLQIAQAGTFASVAKLQGCARMPELEANARVIAAAPELLQALQALMARDLELRLNGFPEVVQARAAIAKATGAES